MIIADIYGAICRISDPVGEAYWIWRRVRLSNTTRVQGLGEGAGDTFLAHYQ